MKLTSLTSESVRVIIHQRFNESQGVITCSLLKNYSEADIVEGLSDQGVSKCHRIIKNAKSPNPQPTATLILTFNTTNTPDRIRIKNWTI